MYKLYFILILSVCTTVLHAQVASKKIEFVGAARSEISNFSLSSDGAVKDSVTPGKRSTGYALIDLGFKINPNSSTEILGMIRIRNAFGGYWGSGVTFDVRQLYVRGVISNAFRYQLGNIDYKLTPYTFYNHNPDQLIELNGLQQIKQDIVNYESFYSNKNTWRQQGAAGDIGFEFKRFVKEVKFNGFITRLNTTNFTSILERLYGGGNMLIQQSKYLELGVNYVSAFDLLGTATNTNGFRNNVTTVSYKVNVLDKKWYIGLSGESGMSSLYKTQDTTAKLNDYFIDAALTFLHKKSNVKFKVGYMDIGADFRSIGAQSKRIDFNKQNTLYDRYTNEQVVRDLSTFDFYQNSSLYNAGISDKLMAYNPIYNNVLTYGKATFNRRGLYTSLSYSDSAKRFMANMDAYFLSEIRGQGTTLLKKFVVVNTNLKWDVSKTFKFNLPVMMTAGASYQNTNRSSAMSYEAIDLTSTLVNAGLDIEVVKQLHVLAGINYLQAKGNELMPLRKESGEVYDFSAITVDGKETILSAGLRFDFSSKIYLAGLYDHFTTNYSGKVPYQLNQFLIVYTMKF